MWKNLLPEEVAKVLNVYSQVAETMALPYVFILHIESIKYLPILHSSAKEMTLSNLITYLSEVEKIDESIIVELDSLRKVRNNMAHDLMVIEMSLYFMEIFEEYMSSLDRLIERIVKELQLKSTSHKLSKSNLFDK